MTRAGGRKPAKKTEKDTRQRVVGELSYCPAFRGPGEPCVADAEGADFVVLARRFGDRFFLSRLVDSTSPGFAAVFVRGPPRAIWLTCAGWSYSSGRI